jgi:hypothetical protein
MDYRFESTRTSDGKFQHLSTKMVCTKYNMNLLVSFPVTLREGKIVSDDEGVLVPTDGSLITPAEGISCKYVDLTTFRHYYKAHPIEARRERFPGILAIYEDMNPHG